MSEHQRPSSSVGQHERRQQRPHPSGERRQTVCTGSGWSPEARLSPCRCHRAGLSAGTSALLPLAPREKLQRLSPAPSRGPAVPGRVSLVHAARRAPRGVCRLCHWQLPALPGSSTAPFGWLLPSLAAPGGLDEARGCCEGESDGLGAAGDLSCTPLGSHPPQAAWSILGACGPAP